LNFGRKGDLEILFEGDEQLFNQYSYLPISSVLYPKIKYQKARIVENWLVSKKASELMKNYKIMGQNLFFPNPK
jgi:tungstate transport system substrate-binding protein